MTQDPFRAFARDLKHERREQKRAHDFREQRAVIFTKVRDLARMKINIACRDHLLGRFAFVMNYLRGPQIHDFPARAFRAITPIEFFLVHKEAFIESADLIVDIAPHKHRRAVDPIHRLNRVVACVAQIIMRQHAIARKPFLQKRGFEKRGGKCGKAPP